MPDITVPENGVSVSEISSIPNSSYALPAEEALKAISEILKRELEHSSSLTPEQIHAAVMAEVTPIVGALGNWKEVVLGKDQSPELRTFSFFRNTCPKLLEALEAKGIKTKKQLIGLLLDLKWSHANANDAVNGFLRGQKTFARGSGYSEIALAVAKYAEVDAEDVYPKMIFSLSRYKYFRERVPELLQALSKKEITTESQLRKSIEKVMGEIDAEAFTHFLNGRSIYKSDGTVSLIASSVAGIAGLKLEDIYPSKKPREHASRALESYAFLQTITSRPVLLALAEKGITTRQTLIQGLLKNSLGEQRNATTLAAAVDAFLEGNRVYGVDGRVSRTTKEIVDFAGLNADELYPEKITPLDQYKHFQAVPALLAALKAREITSRRLLVQALEKKGWNKVDISSALPAYFEGVRSYNREGTPSRMAASVCDIAGIAVDQIYPRLAPAARAPKISFVDRLTSYRYLRHEMPDLLEALELAGITTRDQLVEALKANGWEEAKAKLQMIDFLHRRKTYDGSGQISDIATAIASIAKLEAKTLFTRPVSPPSVADIHKAAGSIVKRERTARGQGTKSSPSAKQSKPSPDFSSVGRIGVGTSSVSNRVPANVSSAAKDFEHAQKAVFTFDPSDDGAWVKAFRAKFPTLSGYIDDNIKTIEDLWSKFKGAYSDGKVFRAQLLDILEDKKPVYSLETGRLHPLLKYMQITLVPRDQQRDELVFPEFEYLRTEIASWQESSKGFSDLMRIYSDTLFPERNGRVNTGQELVTALVHRARRHKMNTAAFNSYAALLNKSLAPIVKGNLTALAVEVIDLFKIPSSEVAKINPLLNDGNLIYTDLVRQEFPRLAEAMRQKGMFTLAALKDAPHATITNALAKKISKLLSAKTPDILRGNTEDAVTARETLSLAMKVTPELLFAEPNKSATRPVHPLSKGKESRPDEHM